MSLPPPPPLPPSVCQNDMYHYLQQNNNSLHIQRSICICVAVLEATFFLALVFHTYTQWKTKKSLFNTVMLTLLYLGTFFQAFELIVFLVATNSNRVEQYLTFGTLAAGQKLAFDDCARGLRILTCMNEAICTCLQITLALKYQLVASSMEQYVTGNLNSLRTSNRIKIFFGLMITATIAAFATYLAMCFKVLKGDRLIKMEKNFLIAGLALLITLFATFIKSMIQLETAIRNTTNGKSNRWMMLLNLLFFGTLMVTQLFFVISWTNTNQGIVVVEIVRDVVELAEKIVILFLVKQYGTSITVKTFLLANGDLIIVGTDHQNRETFQFCVHSLKKIQKKTSSLTEDGFDQSSSHNESIFEEFLLDNNNDEYEKIQWKQLDQYQAEQISIMSRLIHFNRSSSRFSMSNSITKFQKSGISSPEKTSPIQQMSSLRNSLQSKEIESVSALTFEIPKNRRTLNLSQLAPSLDQPTIVHSPSSQNNYKIQETPRSDNEILKSE